ncbi:MAG: DUF2007 domain-containing protein [Deltaproteobacteria bacterium]|nr:MAG: DUF2007 domain-containing protein [Deltaproteobacteria bacterium]
MEISTIFQTMAYCPKCKAEYQPGIRFCADCGVKLTSFIEPEKDNWVNFKEIYISYSGLEAERIKTLLEENWIDCIVRNMRISPYPINIGSFSEHRIAVDEEKKAQAIEIIQEAIADGYISRKGKFKPK